MEYADLAIIDLEEAKTPEGRARLAPRVRDAMRDIGFIVLINHGYTKEQVGPFLLEHSCQGELFLTVV